MKFRKSAVFASIVGGSLVAGVAFAAWTADGTGNGYAQAKSAQAVTTASAAADTVADLYPGASGDVKIKIANPNDYAVRVTAISGGGTITSSSAACNTGGHGVTFADQTGTWDVPAHSAGTLFTLDDAVSMTNASDPACSGASFTVPVSITAASHVPA